MKENKKNINIIISTQVDKTPDFLTFLNKMFNVNVIEYDVWKRNKSQIDLIVFTEGENLHPEAFNQSGKYTTEYLSNTNIDRDFREINLDNSFNSKVPRLGINRGALLLAKKTGSKIIHTINGHNDLHTVTTNYGIFKVISNHNQMIYPFNLLKNQYQIIGYSTNFRSTTYLDSYNKEIELDVEFLEPEIIKLENRLCFQFSPQDQNEEIQNICLKIIDNLLFRDNKNEEINYDWSVLERGQDIHTQRNLKVSFLDSLTFKSSEKTSFGKKYKTQRKSVSEEKQNDLSNERGVDPVFKEYAENLLKKYTNNSTFGLTNAVEPQTRSLRTKSVADEIIEESENDLLK